MRREPFDIDAVTPDMARVALRLWCRPGLAYEDSWRCAELWFDCVEALDVLREPAA